MKCETVAVQRHSRLYRILHWLIVAEVVLLLLSGVGVSTYLPLHLLSRGPARNLHILIGFVWTSTISFFVYYFIASGEYSWFRVSKIGSSFDFLIHEIKSILAGKKPENTVVYAHERKEYVEKIVPTEVLAWWGWFALWSSMALTGLALLFPETFSLVNRLSQALLPSFVLTTAATRAVHMALSLTVVAFMLIHVLASSMYGMVGSMVSGKKAEPIVTPKREEALETGSDS
jgi:cytochrome b subunit of formate dehydrogenase